jgi:mannose-6-phosphate isomerase-like protein (cupin superfamily)
MRLVDLSNQANISSAMLSKIENGRIIPTIPTLFQLITALDVEPSTFFAELNDQNKFSNYLLIRQENYVSYIKEESAQGFNYQSILEHTLGSDNFQISLVTLDPDNKRPQVSTNAFEFLFLIEGQIKFHLEETVLEIRKGDSLFFDGRIPHVPINTQKQPVIYLVIYFFIMEEQDESAKPVSKEIPGARS